LHERAGAQDRCTLTPAQNRLRERKKETDDMRAFGSLITQAVLPVVAAGRARFLSFAPKSTAKTTKS
jgi:hypothetical protein